MRSTIARWFRRLPPIARRDERIRLLSRQLKQEQRAARTAKADLAAARARAQKHKARAEGLVVRIERARQDAANHRQQAERHQRLAARAKQDAVRQRDTASRLEYPGFSTLLGHHRSYIEHARDLQLHAVEPILLLPHKLRGISFAHSHGIPTAEVYKVWPTLASVDLTDLPDKFVLKADGGAGGHAVLPLVRTAGGFRRVDGQDVLTLDDLRAHLQRLGARARAPFFAEEFLESAPDCIVPDDIKVYTFYGEPVQVLLLRSASTEVRRLARRYLDPVTGADLGHVLANGTYDDTIPVPERLAEIVDAARHLSRASGADFCRVDLYETADGIRLGEITRAPGGAQRYIHEHDEALGRAWLDARARLRVDHARGRPFSAVWGHHPYEWYYPDSAEPFRMSALPRPSATCGEWC